MGTNERASRLSAGLVMSLVVFAVARVSAVYSRLPARMASHFGPSGVPDAYMERDSFLSFMGLVCAGMAVLVFGLPAGLRGMAGAINVPNRDYWLAPARREVTLQRLGAWLRWFALPLTAFVVLVLELTLRANLHGGALDITAFGAGLALYLGTNVVLCVALFRAFRLPRAAGRAT